MHILVLEASTSSAKAMVYAPGAGILRLESSRYPAELSNGITQDARGLMDVLLSVGKKACEGFEISLIVLSGIWHSTLLTQQGLPASPVYTWAHVAASQQASRVRADAALTAAVYQRTGCLPHASYPAYRLRYLRDNGLDLSPYEINGYADFLFSELTGQRGTSLNMASGTGLLNIQTLDWDEKTLADLGLSRTQVPPIRPSLTTAPLLNLSAMRLGLPSGIPVSLPFADGFMNQLGAGAREHGQLTISVGTSCAIRTLTNQPLTDDHSRGLWCYYGIDRWLIGAATTGGTSSLDWFRDTLAPQHSLPELDQMAQVRLQTCLSDAGDHDRAIASPLPVFLPFQNGERSPGWRERPATGFFGVQASHTLGDLYQAALEGVLYNVYQCYERLVQVVPVQSINLSGGILYSPHWRQMAADLFQRDLLVPESEQASLLGGAVLGQMILGVSPAADEMAFRQQLVIKPDPSRASYYQHNYQRYLEAYTNSALAKDAQTIL